MSLRNGGRLCPSGARCVTEKRAGVGRGGAGWHQRSPPSPREGACQRVVNEVHELFQRGCLGILAFLFVHIRVKCHGLPTADCSEPSSWPIIRNVLQRITPMLRNFHGVNGLRWVQAKGHGSPTAEGAGGLRAKKCAGQEGVTQVKGHEFHLMACFRSFP